MELIISNIEHRQPNERVEKKWKPVVEQLSKYNNIEEDSIKNFISIYAEFYQIFVGYKSSYNDYTSQFGIIEEPKNHTDVIYYIQEQICKNKDEFLPHNLRILSKLNLKDKQIDITTDDEYINTETVSIKFNRGQIYDIGNQLGKLSVIEMFESKLMEQLIIDINKKLETGNKLIVKYFVDDIKLINDKAFEPSFVLYSKYKVE